MSTIIPTVIRITELLPDYGLSPDDVLKLHHFGFFDTLPLPRYTVAKFRRKLDEAYPDNIPSSFQCGIYQLAMTLINNDPKNLSVFTSPRVHFYWTNTGDLTAVNIKWHLYHQASYPCRYLPDETHPGYSGCSDPVKEPRPRLLDRLQPISDDDAERYLAVTRGLLSPLMYDTLYHHLFEGKTFSQIAKSRSCTADSISASYHTAIRHLSYRSRFADNLYSQIFGDETLGALREYIV